MNCDLACECLGLDPFGPPSSSTASKLISKRGKRRKVEDGNGSVSAESQEDSGAAALKALAADEQQDQDFSLRHLMDYSRHPLVLGQGFKESDIRVAIVQPVPTTRQCGLILATINQYRLCLQLGNSGLPRTYRVRCQFGRSTDNGWTDGATMEKTTAGAFVRPEAVAKALAAITGSHQREAFKTSKVGCNNTFASLMCHSHALTRTYLHNLPTGIFITSPGQHAVAGSIRFCRQGTSTASRWQCRCNTEHKVGT